MNDRLKVSIYGDSISTFEGYSNVVCPKNVVYFPQKGMVREVNDTWWMRMIIDNEFELLINNSSSGCYVKGVGNCSGSTEDEGLGYRITKLKTKEQEPDLIFVYMGINDLNFNKPSEEFKNDYHQLIEKLIELYPNSKLILLNFQKVSYDERAELRRQYNQIVNDECMNHNLVLVDLENMRISGKDYINNSSDDLHPNVLGMAWIAETVTKTLRKLNISKTK